MVAVRETHLTNLRHFVFEDWLNSLTLADRTRGLLMQAWQYLHPKIADNAHAQDILSNSVEMVSILSELNMDDNSLLAALFFPFIENEILSSMIYKNISAQRSKNWYTASLKWTIFVNSIPIVVQIAYKSIIFGECC